MKKLTSALIKKMLSATLLSAFIITSLVFVPQTTNAAMSSIDVTALTDIMRRNGYLSVIQQISLILGTGSASFYESGNTTTTNTTNTTNNVSATNITLCNYAKGINKILTLNTNDFQVKFLQQLLNTLAQQNTSYQPITTFAEGSYGNETTYFGPATQAAVSRWQSINMKGISGYSFGTLDSLTLAKMKNSYCGTSKGTAATSGRGSSSSSSTDNSGTSGTGAGFLSPVLSFEKTSVDKGDQVKYTYNLNNLGSGSQGCRLYKNYVNQDQLETTTIFSQNSGTSVDTPYLTTEYYINCPVGGGASTESDHVTVVVDGVAAGATAGTGNQTIETSAPSYLMSGGAYRYFFYLDSNTAAASVYLYFDTSDKNCTSMSNKVLATNTLTSTFIATVEASELASNKKYYYCAVAVTSDGSVAAQSSVESFTTN